MRIEIFTRKREGVLIKGLVYLFYLLIAKRLTDSHARLLGPMFKKVRQACGRNVNIETGADFVGAARLR